MSLNEKRTITPKKVFVNDKKQNGEPYKDGAKRIVMYVPSRDGELKVSGFWREGDMLPREDVEMTVELWEDKEYGWQFRPEKGATLDEINEKLDLVLAALSVR